MLEEQKISLIELASFGSIENLNEQAISLVKQQCSTWELADKNFAALKNIQSKTFDFDHFEIITQFNPERIRSSAAKTDAKTIARRPCFLCLENLPAKQKGILFQNDYLTLTNPFPIFQKHLTISKLNHTPQLIYNYLEDLLDLSRTLNDFTVFYNGPQCGASAPDHFHFQAGNKGLLPFEKEFQILEAEFSTILFENKRTKVFAVENYLRPFVSIVSNDKKDILKYFKKIYRFLETGEGEEPMLNILCHFENENWKLTIFPREKQRPSHFYRSDKKQIITGPAAVEFGGLLILPRKEDFEKITKHEILEIYKEVAIQPKAFSTLIEKIGQL